MDRAYTRPWNHGQAAKDYMVNGRIAVEAFGLIGFQ